MVTTGERIRKLRELRGYSQNYMAAKLNISQEQYSYMETKKKSIPDEQLKDIAALLGVSEDMLKTFDPHSIIQNTFNDSSQGYFQLNFHNLIIQSHENETKAYRELIERLKEEIAELKKKK
jgi:transcriptional regulator with XRE-family HTH domain